MTKQEQQQEALDRAQGGLSLTNYPAIFQGFIAKGIAEADIEPRVNVFTFNAWKAKGRSVKKGEHGVRVTTFITIGGERDELTGEVTGGTRRPHTTVVFHVSQTEPTEAYEERRAARGSQRGGWQRGRNGRDYRIGHPSGDQSWRSDPGEQAADRWNETHGDRWIE